MVFDLNLIDYLKLRYDTCLRKRKGQEGGCVERLSAHTKARKGCNKRGDVPRDLRHRHVR